MGELGWHSIRYLLPETEFCCRRPKTIDLVGVACFDQGVVDDHQRVCRDILGEWCSEGETGHGE